MTLRGAPSLLAFLRVKAVRVVYSWMPVATRARSASWWKQRKTAPTGLAAAVVLPLLSMVVRDVVAVVQVGMAQADRAHMVDEAALGGDGALDPSRGFCSLLFFVGSSLRC